MGQGDVPTSRGGPLRRRREKRQLEHLAAASPDREGTPPPAAAHVRVIEDRDEARPQPVVTEEPDQAEDNPRPRTGGFHVRAVPIDQPLANEEV